MKPTILVVALALVLAGCSRPDPLTFTLEPGLRVVVVCGAGQIADLRTLPGEQLTRGTDAYARPFLQAGDEGVVLNDPGPVVDRRVTIVVNRVARPHDGDLAGIKGTVERRFLRPVLSASP